MTEECHSHSVQTSSHGSCKNMTWISSVELTRSVSTPRTFWVPNGETLAIQIASLSCPLTNMYTPLIFTIWQVVEDGYEFFAKRHLVTLFSAPNYCGEFDNAGAMMSVDETLLCSFQVCLVRFYVSV